jgi:hypothetical protein
MKLKPKHTCPDSQTILSNKWIVTGNHQGGGFGNEQGDDDAGGASNDGEAREGMQMTVTTWTKCFRPLDQKY